MKKMILSLCIVLACVSSPAQADPGDYALRVLAGPSFAIKDFSNQARFGGEFYYDVGYNMSINLLSLFGVKDTFRYQLMPGFGYNYLYLGPAVFHALFGVGYGRIDKSNTLDFRFSTGLRLPLGDHMEAYTDVNYFMSPLGTPGNPQTFDWLLGLAFNFKK